MTSGRASARRRSRPRLDESRFLRLASTCAEVTWIGRFFRADTGNFPPDHLNDEAAVKAMTGFMQEGLKGLKAKVEGKS